MKEHPELTLLKPYRFASAGLSFLAAAIITSLVRDQGASTPARLTFVLASCWLFFYSGIFIVATGINKIRLKKYLSQLPKKGQDANPP